MAFKGSNYHGWQRQPNVPSVQQQFELILNSVLSSNVIIHPCGRTDKGVHASQFFIHMDYPQIISKPEFIFRMNKQLPLDIRVINLFAVHSRAHAQYDAISRTYGFYFHQHSNPLIGDISLQHNLVALDHPLLQKVIDYSKKINDFRSVCIRPDQYDHTTCEILDIQLDLTPSNMVINITANRFLQGMMRLWVGRILDVATHKITFDRYLEVMNGPAEFEFNPKLPPHGLRLIRVEYDWERIGR